jgi:hypothetical protein
MVTKGGSVDSFRNFSQAARQGSISPGGGGMYDAVAIVLPGLPIQFWDLPKLSGSGLMSPDAGHEFFVQLASEPYAKRQSLQPQNSVLKSNHLVADLPKIVGTTIYSRARFGVSADLKGSHSGRFWTSQKAGRQ